MSYTDVNKRNSDIMSSLTIKCPNPMSAMTATTVVSSAAVQSTVNLWNDKKIHVFQEHDHARNGYVPFNPFARDNNYPSFFDPSKVVETYVCPNAPKKKDDHHIIQFNNMAKRSLEEAFGDAALDRGDEFV